MASKANCGFIDWSCKAQDVAAGAAEKALALVADQVQHMITDAVKSLGTFWVDVSTPGVQDSMGKTTDTVAFLQDSLTWYGLAFMGLAIMFGATQMAVENRAQPMIDLVKGIFRFLVVSACGVLFIQILLLISDGFASWIIKESTKGTSFSANLIVALGLGSTAAPLLVILLGLCAWFSSLIQVGMMMARGATISMAAGILVFSASATNTETGSSFFKKIVGFLLAVIAFKPAAAFVYAAAFRLTGTATVGSETLKNAAGGLILMVLALFTLPALMKLIVPQVSNFGGGRSGGGAGGLLAAGATGAAMVARSGSSAGSSQPAPSGSTSVTNQTGGPQSTTNQSSSTNSTNQSSSTSSTNPSTNTVAPNTTAAPASAGAGATATTATAQAGAGAATTTAGVAGSAGTAATTSAAAKGAAGVAGPAGAVVSAGIEVAKAAHRAMESTVEQAGPTGSGQ